MLRICLILLCSDRENAVLFFDVLGVLKEKMLCDFLIVGGSERENAVCFYYFGFSENGNSARCFFCWVFGKRKCCVLF